MLNSSTSLSCSRPTWRAVRLDREIQAVTRIDKLWDRLLSRFSERNFAFEDLRTLLLGLGFDERIRGGTTSLRVRGSRRSSTCSPKVASRSRTKFDRCASSSRDTGFWKDATMDELRYEIVLFWSEEDQAYIAEVPELPGCMADGTTYEGALKAAEVVIREWIETARDLGRPIPQPRRRKTAAK